MLQSTCLCFPLTNMDGQPHSCNEQFCDVKNLVLWCRRCNQTLKGPPHPSNPSGFFQPPFQSPPSQPLALETGCFPQEYSCAFPGARVWGSPPLLLRGLSTWLYSRRGHRRVWVHSWVGREEQAASGSVGRRLVSLLPGATGLALTQ